MKTQIIVALISGFTFLLGILTRYLITWKTRHTKTHKNMNSQLDNLTYELIEYQNKVISLSTEKYNAERKLEEVRHKLQNCEEICKNLNNKNTKLIEEYNSLEKRYNDLMSDHKETLYKNENLKKNNNKTN